MLFSQFDAGRDGHVSQIARVAVAGDFACGLRCAGQFCERGTRTHARVNLVFAEAQRPETKTAIRVGSDNARSIGGIQAIGSDGRDLETRRQVTLRRDEPPGEPASLAHDEAKGSLVAGAGVEPFGHCIGRGGVFGPRQKIRAEAMAKPFPAGK